MRQGRVEHAVTPPQQRFQEPEIIDLGDQGVRVWDVETVDPRDPELTAKAVKVLSVMRAGQTEGPNDEKYPRIPKAGFEALGGCVVLPSVAVDDVGKVECVEEPANGTFSAITADDNEFLPAQGRTNLCIFGH